ncbi:hypothetical protein NW739_04060 [Mycoplasmopsis felis]|uniref:hypothetical protein n=1 Tax=Mycoplasmopsis felis TaxID=33923 RepID=UPI0021DF8DCD|nr:hypothetical protein [Mycoplasmopsis felis]MCU9939890.1 hypothetical protein [Mycoplasmopsis felis]
MICPKLISLFVLKKPKKASDEIDRIIEGILETYEVAILPIIPGRKRVCISI